MEQERFWSNIHLSDWTGTVPHPLHCRWHKRLTVRSSNHSNQDFLLQSLHRDNWNQGFVDTGKYNDELYMVSLGITAQALYVNETLLNELGMELWPEDEDITWSEFARFHSQDRKSTRLNSSHT